MVKQILHLKIAQNLGFAGIRLRMGSYKRFHSTQNVGESHSSIEKVESILIDRIEYVKDTLTVKLEGVQGYLTNEIGCQRTKIQDLEEAIGNLQTRLVKEISKVGTSDR